MLQLRNVKPASCGMKEHFNSYTTADQSGVGSHFGSCSALSFLHNSLHFFSFVSFLQNQNRRTLKSSQCNFAATLQILCWGKFKDFSRQKSRIQGPFQGFLAIQGFSRIYFKIQGLFNTVRTLLCNMNMSWHLPLWIILWLSLR